MKKLLGILVLGLLISSNAYAQILKLKCTYKSFDEKFEPSFKVGDEIIENWDLNVFLVNDDYIRHYDVLKIGDTHYVHYQEINRYSGEKIFKSAEVPEEDYKKVSKVPKIAVTEEAFYKIVALTNKWFIKNKISKDLIWIEHKSHCEKAKKQF